MRVLLTHPDKNVADLLDREFSDSNFEVHRIGGFGTDFSLGQREGDYDLAIFPDLYDFGNFRKLRRLARRNFGEYFPIVVRSTGIVEFRIGVEYQPWAKLYLNGSVINISPEAEEIVKAFKEISSLS
tara:strand:+ start:3860 stop:4240 length:381 start_codon:yes stop_codon:yes gene_type:complete